MLPLGSAWSPYQEYNEEDSDTIILCYGYCLNPGKAAESGRRFAAGDGGVGTMIVDGFKVLHADGEPGDVGVFF